MKRKLKARNNSFFGDRIKDYPGKIPRKHLIKSDRGFTIPIAVGMGLIMVLIAGTLIFVSQKDQIISEARNRTGESIAVAEAGVARTLIQLTQPQNAVLLTKNYDPINPKTNKTYLGADGIPNTDDEESTAKDEWMNWTSSLPCPAVATTGTPNISYTNTIGDGQYRLLAYRYDKPSQTGTFLVEGKELIPGQPKPAISYIAVKVAIETKIKDFPGVLSSEPIVENDSLNVGGRKILGSNGNIYFDPLSHSSSLNGYAAPSDANRSNYVAAISSVATDNISGKIFACRLLPNLPYTPPAGTTTLTDITSNLRISATVSGGITYYQTSKIDITNSTIDVDTTNGSVYLYVTGESSLQDRFILKGNAKIRNVRTDGKPPRVGDLRIFIALSQTWGQSIQVSDNVCIQTAFLYNPYGDLALNSSGNGCPGNVDTNIDGVVWAEDVFLQPITGVTSGIAVPEDVSSLSDITANLGLPTTNKISNIKSWQRYKL